MNYVADFETTTTEESTKVWASALVPFYSEEVQIDDNISDFMWRILSFEEESFVYFHNLSFDGSFILNWLDGSGLINMMPFCEEQGKIVFDGQMPNGSYEYLITEMGQWYYIRIKTWTGVTVEIRDSLKLIPFSVKTIGKSFGTKHQKLEMDYTRHNVDCEITDEERLYISNDVLVVKEALEIMYSKGYSGITIGTCCFKEFKGYYDYCAYTSVFPDLTKNKIDRDRYGSKDADLYIRKSYHGGWCYVNPKYQGKELGNGRVYDVNSLYPYVMESREYPIGQPHFFVNKFPDNMPVTAYYFVRVKGRFRLKANKLPTIQIKCDVRYPFTEWLSSSKSHLKPKLPECAYLYKDDTVTLTMTKTDWILFNEHYDNDMKILDGCWFYTCKDLFSGYVSKHKQEKIEADKAGNKAMRQIAKLFLNNLYGKMATNRIATFRKAELKDGVLKFSPVIAEDKRVGYIPIGSAITSYARDYTIRHAQKNYDRFIYADTDSIHLIGSEEPIDIEEDDYKFGAWKNESNFDNGIFVRQKTYMEISGENVNIKCAGMPEKVKQLFIQGMKDGKFTIKDFRQGLTLDGKLIKKQTKGGSVLVETTFTMK